MTREQNKGKTLQDIIKEVLVKETEWPEGVVLPDDWEKVLSSLNNKLQEPDIQKTNGSPDSESEVKRS